MISYGPNRAPAARFIVRGFYNTSIFMDSSPKHGLAKSALSLTLPRHAAGIHKRSIGLKGECPHIAVFGGERDFVHALGVSGVPPGNHAVGECALATLVVGFQRVSTHAFTNIPIGPSLNAHAYERVPRL